MVSTKVAYEAIGQLLSPGEYDALPPDSRREFVDAVILVRATPAPYHQDVVDVIKATLSGLAPKTLRVTREVEIRLGDTLRRNPDVSVVWADGYDRRVPRLLPGQVLLALEVVSPGSEHVDRDIKPAEYATAGIPHFWRVETTPEIVVSTFRLGDHRAYVQTGVFGGGDLITAPGLTWAQFAVSALVD
jgi:Uma2 family endonuclease